jgi:non-specific serine/threonine protein kinase
LESGRALSEEIGDRQELAGALRMLGHLATEQGDWEKAKRYYGDSLALAEEIGDRFGSARTLFAFAMLAYVRGVFTEARTYCERSKPIAEEIGASGLSMDILQILGWSACQQEAYDEAEIYHQEAVGLARQIALPVGVACAQARLGYVLVLQGRREEGWALLVQELCSSLASELSAQALPEILQIVGQMGVHLGQFQRGAELLGLGFRIDPWRPEAEQQARPELDMLRAALGAEELEAALARGGATDLHQAVAEILASDTPEAYWGSGLEKAPAGGDRTRP